MPQGKWSLGKLTNVLPSEDGIVQVVSQNSRMGIHMKNNEDNSLKMQPSMMRFLKEEGVMNSEFNITYTCLAVHSNFNIMYF